MAQPKPDQEQCYRVYTSTWQNIAREDSNIASRIGWAIGLSTGLFAAIAFMTPRINDGCNGVFWPPIICLAICGMAGLGLFFSFRTKLGVEAAHDQIEYLRSHYFHRLTSFDELGLPRPFGDTNLKLGRKSSGVYPIALLFFWSVILLAGVVGTGWTFVRAANGEAPAACRANSDQQPAGPERAPVNLNQTPPR